MTVQELKEAVKKVDIEEAIKDAEEMGVEVREKKSGWHTIIQDDKEVLLDTNKHFKLP